MDDALLKRAQIVIVAVAVVMLTVGLLAPRVAIRVTLLLMISVAIVAAATAFAGVLRRMPTAQRSVFRLQREATAPAVLPPHIQRLEDAQAWETDQIPYGARTAIASIAASRLKDHHGINVSVTEHLPAARQLVSPPMWSLIRPDEYDPTANLLIPRPQIPRSAIPGLLDELEQL